VDESHLHTFTVGGVLYVAPRTEWEVEVRDERHLPGPDWIRILYPAAVFSFMHWFNVVPYVPLMPRHVVIMVVSTFALGVVWMWFQLRERSLVFPIASHFAIDAFALPAMAMQHQPHAA